MLRFVALPALFVIGALAAPAPAIARLTPCPKRAQCLGVRVPLDRAGAVPGTIAMRAAVLRGADGADAPLVLLTGGPGQDGVSFTADWAELARRTKIRRTIVTVDVRGSGDSGLLRCPAFERALETSPVASAGGCGRLLGPRHAFYRSSDTADDLEALRVRLGAPKLAILAVSYGTRIAVDYARRYPSQTDRIILDSAVSDDTDAFAAETFTAIPRVVRELCAAPRGCTGGGPSPVRDLGRLAQRLKRRPVTVRVRGEQVRLDEDTLLGTFIGTDLVPVVMARFPEAVRRALGGDPSLLARIARLMDELNSGGTVHDFSSALFAATLCEEAPTPWDRRADPAERRRQGLAVLAARSTSSLAGFSRDAAYVAGLLPLCATWPAPVRPEPAPAPAASPVPVLVLSGLLDLRTPLEAARRLATTLGNATVVTAPGVGHSVFGARLRDCATRSAAAFLRGQLPRCARA